MYKALTHMVHLYGRFPRKTSNSNPAVITISQLASFQLDINAHAFPWSMMNTNM
jgi:hypothetical protein